MCTFVQVAELLKALEHCESNREMSPIRTLGKMLLWRGFDLMLWYYCIMLLSYHHTLIRGGELMRFPSAH